MNWAWATLGPKMQWAFMHELFSKEWLWASKAKEMWALMKHKGQPRHTFNEGFIETT